MAPERERGGGGGGGGREKRGGETKMREGEERERNYNKYRIGEEGQMYIFIYMYTVYMHKLVIGSYRQGEEALEID